jgi:hypothetical protein
MKIMIMKMRTNCHNCARKHSVVVISLTLKKVICGGGAPVWWYFRICV